MNTQRRTEIEKRKLKKTKESSLKRITVGPNIRETSLSGKDTHSPSVAEYNATFKSFNVSDAPRFSKSKPVLLISVGREYHESDQLKSTIDLINAYDNELKKSGKLGFTNLTVLVAGSLQRHGGFFQFAAEMPIEQLTELLAGDDINANMSSETLAFVLARRFYSHAQAAEEDYIRRNKQIFKQLNMLYEFKRWGDYVPEHHLRGEMADDISRITETQARYVTQMETILQLYYNKNDNFSKAVDTTAAQFLKHKDAKIHEAAACIKKARPDLASINFVEVAKFASVHYILEECPVLIPILSQLGHDNIMYPGDMTEALKFTNAIHQQQSDQKLARWVPINLKHTNPEKAYQQNVIHGSSGNITTTGMQLPGLKRRHSFPGTTSFSAALAELSDDASDEETAAIVPVSTAEGTKRSTSPLLAKTIFHIKMQTGGQQPEFTDEAQKAVETLLRLGARVKVTS